jgi:hypothetical protein
MDERERQRQLPEDFDEEMWPESLASASEADQLLTLVETPSEWPPHEQRIQQGDEEAVPEATAPTETQLAAAVEEWTAGMIRASLDAESREFEEEPIEAGSQPPLKSPEAAELEANYGI